jgi:hypothetical protein
LGKIWKISVRDGGGTPAHGPGALHRSHRLAAMLGPDRLADQHRTRGPFAAEAEALKAAHDEELPEILGQARECREDGEPENGDLQQPDPADPIRQHAGDPAAECRDDQRAGCQQPSLGFVDIPNRDQRRNDEAVDLHVEGIEPPAAETCPEGPPLAGAQLAIPLEHLPPPVLGQPARWVLAQ